MKNRLTFFAEFIENLFYPDKVVIAGGILVILLFINSNLAFNNTVTFFLSLLVFFITSNSIKKIVKNADKSFLLSAIASTIIFLLLVRLLQVSKELEFGAISIFFNLVILFIVRSFWKISAHTSVYTNFSTTLSLIYSNFILTFIFLPIIVWSRIRLKRHTYSQVIIGGAVGSILPIIIHNLLFISI